MQMRFVRMAVAFTAVVVSGENVHAASPKPKTKDDSMSTQGDEGARPTDVKQLAEKIGSMGENQRAALANSLAEDARSSARMAAKVLWTGDERAPNAAQALLTDMDETAILALVEPAPHPKVQERVWVLETVVDAELALRRKVMKRPEKSLDDKTTIPDSIHGPVERIPPKRRVCDEAYLLMRKIVHVGEKINDVVVNESMFLNLPDEVKDAKIREARRSGEWNRAITGKEVQEYIRKSGEDLE
jgi:hypothetical protein